MANRNGRTSHSFRAKTAATVARSPMRLLIKQQDGRLLPLDLSSLAKGVKEPNHRQKYTYEGRPLLAADFLAPVEDYAYTHSANSFAKIVFALSLLWRFLDAHPHLPVNRLKDLTDVHGTSLTLWLRESDIGTYRQLKTLVSRAREHHNLSELYWPTIHDRVDPVHSRDLDPPTVIGVYRALIFEAQQIKAMFREGETLARNGTDPRSTSVGSGGRPRLSGWHLRENHAWLIKAIAVPTIAETKEFRRHGCSGLHQSNKRNQLHSGPQYLAPGHSPRASQGIVGKLRWFYPSLNDTIIFFLLFLLTTGWNESTALNIDISEPNWARTHQLQPKLKILKSLKPRSRAYQYAVSLEHSEWRPYQIIKYMLIVTEGLRRRLSIDIETLERDPNLPKSQTLQHRLAVLRRQFRSPWLFHSLDHIGQVASLDTNTNTQVNTVLAELLNRHDIRNIRGRRCRWTASDWREVVPGKVCRNVLALLPGAGAAAVQLLRYEAQAKGPNGISQPHA